MVKYEIVQRPPKGKQKSPPWEVRFDDVPPERVKRGLYSMGLRWSKYYGAWCGFGDYDAIERVICGLPNGKVVPGTDGELDHEKRIRVTVSEGFYKMLLAMHEQTGQSSAEITDALLLKLALERAGKE